MPKAGTKRKYPTKPCEDCGRPMKVAAANQRYCFLCKLARGAKWHDGRTSKCPGCGEKYIAWNGTSGTPRCGVCFSKAAPMGGRESIEHECAYHALGTCLSGEPPHTVYAAGFHVCWPCLTDPAKFRSNRAGIAAEHAKLTAARNGGTVDVEAQPKESE